MILNEIYPFLTQTIKFKAIRDNSTLVRPGDIFVARKTKYGDGHIYISDAIYRGAVFIISERELKYFPSLKVPDSNEEFKRLLSFYYKGHLGMHLCGVTGTDGKTTTCTIIHEITSKLASSVEIGTNGIYSNKYHEYINNTTPSSSILYDTLEKSAARKIKYAVLEMSSEGILDGRGEFLMLDAAIFTNITREHLNTHKTMSSYAYTKSKLVDMVKNDGLVIINNDMKYKSIILKKCKNKRVITYGINSGDIVAKIRKYSISYTIFDIYYKKQFLCQIKSNLVGRYNVYNILAAFTYLHEIGFSAKDIKLALNDYIYVDGRFNYYNTQAPHFIIDFGHTPNAISETLKFVKTLKYDHIITILGAQGNKDKGKRKYMGQIASKLSDILILTSEDPKDESIFSILDDLKRKIHKDFYITLSRETAIKTAFDIAKENDLIIIFGKGNEQYEEIQGIKFKHSDLSLINSIKQEKIKALGNA